jgi:hypothetical protein
VPRRDYPQGEAEVPICREKLKEKRAKIDPFFENGAQQWLNAHKN